MTLTSLLYNLVTFIPEFFYHLGVFLVRTILRLPPASRPKHVMLVQHAQIPTEIDLEGRVLNVSDGDTLHIQIDGITEKVRLHGIDCPEIDQPYGKEARLQMKALVFNKIVKVVFKGNDRYGRRIADVYTDRNFLNEEMLRSGYAWALEGKTGYAKYRQLQSEARNSRFGLWSDPKAIPPWTWRQQRGTLLT